MKSYCPLIRTNDRAGIILFWCCMPDWFLTIGGCHYLFGKAWQLYKERVLFCIWNCPLYSSVEMLCGCKITYITNNTIIEALSQRSWHPTLRPIPLNFAFLFKERTTNFEWLIFQRTVRTEHESYTQPFNKKVPSCPTIMGSLRVLFTKRNTFCSYSSITPVKE